MDVFISYSRKDSETAKSIIRCLKDAGLSVFIDEQDIEGGMEFPTELANAIIESKVVLFLASRNSYASSFSMNEIIFAFNEKGSKNLVAYIIDDSKLPTSLRFAFATSDRMSMQIQNAEEYLVPAIKRVIKRQNDGELLQEYTYTRIDAMKELKKMSRNNWLMWLVSILTVCSFAAFFKLAFCFLPSQAGHQVWMQIAIAALVWSLVVNAIYYTCYVFVKNG